MMSLAIVILNWNGKEMLKRFLPSVISNSVGDVIVADNASTDGSIDMMKEMFPKVRTVVMDKNYGFADGYNKALAQLPEYDLYLLLNNDIEIRQKKWDVPLIEYMENHPECGACQPKLMKCWTGEEAEREKGKDEMFEYAGAAGGFLDKYGYPFCRGRIMNDVERDKYQYDEIVPLLWATGAALVVRASDWRASGGLDGRFFAHMEEIDLCWRLRIMGKSIVCISESKAYHLGGATLKQGSPRKTFLNFRNNLLMLYKNLPEEELQKVMFVRGILDYVAALSFLAKGEWGTFCAVFKARREFKRIKKDFVEDRKRIQAMCVNHDIKERMSISILAEYYFKRHKKFSDLNSK